MVCHLDRGRKTRRLGGGMRKYRKIYRGRDQKKYTGVQGDAAKGKDIGGKG